MISPRANDNPTLSIHLLLTFPTRAEVEPATGYTPSLLQPCSRIRDGSSQRSERSFVGGLFIFFFAFVVLRLGLMLISPFNSLIILFCPFFSSFTSAMVSVFNFAYVCLDFTVVFVANQ